MVHRRSKSPGGRKLLGSHNRSWIWGRNVVAETLRAGRWPIVELAVSPKLDAALRNEFHRLAAAADVPVIETDDAGLFQLCRANDHQGCAARMTEFPYGTAEELRARFTDDAILAVLDRIQDPFNFGAMIRTAECLGIDGIVIGSAEQTGVNSQTARSSAGAVNHVPIYKLDDLPGCLTELRDRGWQVWGASERGAVAMEAAEFQPPLALVIGNEGAGIHPDLLARCTSTVQIPMAGRIGSLNAAVSAGILCYEALRARRSQRSSTRQPNG